VLDEHLKPDFLEQIGQSGLGDLVLVITLLALDLADERGDHVAGEIVVPFEQLLVAFGLVLLVEVHLLLEVDPPVLHVLLACDLDVLVQLLIPHHRGPLLLDHLHEEQDDAEDEASLDEVLVLTPVGPVVALRLPDSEHLELHHQQRG